MMFKSLKKYFPKNNTLYDKLVLNFLAVLIFNLIHPLKFIKPYHVSILGLIISIFSAIYFVSNNFILGIFLFQLVLVLDLVDGKISKKNKSGTVFGIIIDSYFDFLVIFINSYALLFSSLADNLTIYLINIFLILNYAESWMDKQMIQVYFFIKNKKNLSWSIIDEFVMKYINFLNRFGLKGIFISYHERYFLIFVLGVYFGEINFFLIITIIIMTILFHLKIIFETTIIKHSIIKKDTSNLNFRDKN